MITYSVCIGKHRVLAVCHLSTPLSWQESVVKNKVQLHALKNCAFRDAYISDAYETWVVMPTLAPAPPPYTHSQSQSPQPLDK